LRSAARGEPARRRRAERSRHGRRGGRRRPRGRRAALAPPPPRARAAGARPTTPAGPAAADVTGILLASVVAALGFFVIPARRAKAKAEMKAKIADVRARLSSALRAQFQEEIGRSTARMRGGIGPYSRFGGGE